MRRARHFSRSESGIIPMLLVLLLAAAAIVGLGAMTLRGASVALKNSKSDNEQLVRLEKAIRAHVFALGLLPCPAFPDGDGTSRAGGCDNNKNDGVVPWVTLGLTKDDIKDSHGNLISYHVDPDLASASQNSVRICQGNDVKPGALRLLPSANTSLFVLISHGANGLGGWPASSASQKANPTSALERENCPDSAINAASIKCVNPDTKNVTQGPYQPDPALPDYFDDIILAANSSDFVYMNNSNNPRCLAPSGGNAQN